MGMKNPLATLSGACTTPWAVTPAAVRSQVPLRFMSVCGGGASAHTPAVAYCDILYCQKSDTLMLLLSIRIPSSSQQFAEGKKETQHLRGELLV